MNGKTLLRVLNWFDTYQSNLDREFAKELYSDKLVPEELEETEKAIKENDLIETIDGLGDLLWVSWGAVYFSNNFNYEGPMSKVMDAFYMKLSFTGDILEIIDRVMNAIADSNYTKVPNLETAGEKVGKVKKGKKFVKPTKELKKIIKQYNIGFRTE